MKRLFTPEEDRIILAGRAAGLSWDAIAKQIGTTARPCKAHLVRDLGVPDPKPVQAIQSKGSRDHDAPPERQKRDILRAGDDASWRAITAGTVLEGSSYR